MKAQAMNAPSLVKLSRKLLRAADVGKGVRIESPDLDLLGSLGLFDIINRAVADYSTEQTQCRDAIRRSTSVANTGSASISSPMEASAALTSISGGTTQARDVNAACQRVQ